MLYIIDALKIVGAIAGTIASLIGLIAWLKPISIVPCVNLIFDGSGPDEITATITNKTGKPIYVISCDSKGTYPWRYTLIRHLR